MPSDPNTAPPAKLAIPEPLRRLERLQRAEQFIRDCARILGDNLSDDVVRRQALKCVAILENVTNG